MCVEEKEKEEEEGGGEGVIMKDPRKKVVN
jgi:hypothetical protein